MKNYPLVSVIIPTKNSENFLDACLRSVKNQSYQNIEIIVVDNFSNDDTVEIAKKYTCNFFEKGSERSTQRNFGAKKSKGKYLLFLDSDMEMTRNVIKKCVSKIEANKNVAGLVIPEKSVGEGFWAKCKALEKEFYLGVEWMEAARFFDKKVFFFIGGYNENMTGPEDWDLPQRIVRKYGKRSIDRVNNFFYHNEGKVTLLGSIKKKYYYAKSFKKYTSYQFNKNNYIKQTGIKERYGLFFSNPRKIIKNPLIWIGLILMKTLEFKFGFIGYLFSNKHVSKL